MRSQLYLSILIFVEVCVEGGPAGKAGGGGIKALVKELPPGPNPDLLTLDTILSSTDKKQKLDAYNISAPEFTCAKRGFKLEGNKCVFREDVEPIMGCPPRYTLRRNDEVTGGPICVRTWPLAHRCLQGQLIEEEDGLAYCELTSFSPPETACPQGYTKRGGDCVRLVEVERVPECVDGSRKIAGKCVILEYHEPEYMCPSNAVQEGKKCKTVKYEMDIKAPKKRLLTAAAAAADEEDEEVVGASQSRYLRVKEKRQQQQDSSELVSADEEDEVNEEIISAEDEELGGFGNKIKIPKKAPRVIKEVKESEKKQTIRFPVEKVTYQKEKPEKIKVEKVKEKVPKAKSAEIQKIMKVRIFPAEKLCPEGARSGKYCISERVVAPELRCPVKRSATTGFDDEEDEDDDEEPRRPGTRQQQPEREDDEDEDDEEQHSHHFKCEKEIVISPRLICKDRTQHIVCGSETECHCVDTESVAAEEICLNGEREDFACVARVPVLHLCPAGYEMNEAFKLCTRVEVEDAVTTFVVSFVCPDCLVEEEPRHEEEECVKNKKCHNHY